jgi:hypothetical protein
MDLAIKSVKELHRLKHFTDTLRNELCDVDDTEDLRSELESFSGAIDLEMMSQLDRM